MTNPISGSGPGPLVPNKTTASTPGESTSVGSSPRSSSEIATSLVAPTISAPVPEPTGPSTPTATIDLSSRGQAAVALMRGADQVAKGYSSAALETLATKISQAIYSPPPESVAKALISYELRFLKGS